MGWTDIGRELGRAGGKVQQRHNGLTTKKGPFTPKEVSSGVWCGGC